MDVDHIVNLSNPPPGWMMTRGIGTDNGGRGGGGAQNMYKTDEISTAGALEREEVWEGRGDRRRGAREGRMVGEGKKERGEGSKGGRGGGQARKGLAREREGLREGGGGGGKEKKGVARGKGESVR